LAFTVNGQVHWTDARTDVVGWPTAPISAKTMAEVLDAAALELSVAAVSIDGPQGWRDPQARRSFPGRLCELQARTPGKTCVYQKTLPGNYSGWARFSIDVFQHLVVLGHARLVNEPTQTSLEPLELGQYYLLECFPSSTWRCSGLTQLPGHSAAPPDVVEDYSRKLIDCFGLPTGALTNHHDHLQAIVSALPAAALLRGPCSPIPRGEAARTQFAAGVAPVHQIEGLIWDAQPSKGHVARAEVTDRNASNRRIGATPEKEMGNQMNPLLPDDRSEDGEATIACGVELFLELVRRNNAGDVLGVSYSGFVELIYGAPFKTVAGRNYLPSDTALVLALASAITAAAGGRQTVRRNASTIDAAMDSFIWQKYKPHDRDDAAWSRSCLPYSKADWIAVFPEARRTLLRKWSARQPQQ